MRISNYFLASLLVFSFVLGSCDEDETEIKGTGSVVVELDHRAGSEALVLGKDYKNANGDTMRFSMFNYYLSNFEFIKADGSTYKVPKDSSYFLVKHEDAESRELKLKGIPAGDYQSVRFTIGIDSAKSVSPAAERTGILDPAAGAAGMYWAWNSGYIFVKAEGTSPQAPLDQQGNRTFRYHIGLFGGYSSPTLNNLKTVTLTPQSGDLIKVREGHTPNVHTLVNLLDMFNSPNMVKVSENSIVMVSPYSPKVAENYANMFKVHHVHN